MNPKDIIVSSSEDVNSPASPEQNDSSEDPEETSSEPEVSPGIEYPEDEEVLGEGGSMGIGLAEDSDYLTNSQTSICSSVYGNSLPSRSPDPSRDTDLDRSKNLIICLGILAQ
jgi:hypothetical protein